MFLLKNSYFPELKSVCRRSKTYKTELGTVDGEGRFSGDSTARQSDPPLFEIRTKVGSSEKVSVLKIRAQILSEKFLAHKIVHVALQKMDKTQALTARVHG